MRAFFIGVDMETNILASNLIAEWHPFKNFDLTPNDVTFKSNKKVWWKCAKVGHEWEARVCSRTGGNNCPYCAGQRVCHDNCLATLNPKLAQEWHPTKNDITPNSVTLGSHKKVWWRCLKMYHEWEANIYSRNKGNNCPYCAGQKVCNDNCLATVNPELVNQWHPTKNGDLTPYNVTMGSSRQKVWWVCRRGHEWEVCIHARTRKRKNGCPYCGCKKVCEDNCLATLRPDLASQWHPTKNGSLTPKDIVLASEKRIWWLCHRGHEWKCVMSSRKHGSGCPYCCGKRVCEDNCLATLDPELAKEWHPTKNDDLTPKDVTFSSAKKVWWRCPKMHEWIARVDNRHNGKGCSHCIVFKKEVECRNIFENIFDEKFPRNRKVLECRLELDGYCENLKLAFEYNGEQHYHFIPFWHKTRGKFLICQARDLKKARLCEERGIKLITIPYTENHRLEEFIEESLAD